MAARIRLFPIPLISPNLCPCLSAPPCPHPQEGSRSSGSPAQWGQLAAREPITALRFVRVAPSGACHPVKTSIGTSPLWVTELNPPGLALDGRSLFARHGARTKAPPPHPWDNFPHPLPCHPANLKPPSLPFGNKTGRRIRLFVPFSTNRYVVSGRGRFLPGMGRLCQTTEQPSDPDSFANPPTHARHPREPRSSSATIRVRPSILPRLDMIDQLRTCASKSPCDTQRPPPALRLRNNSNPLEPQLSHHSEQEEG